MANGKGYKPVKLKRWKVLKVAAKAHNISLALRTIGLPRLPSALKRLFTPQTEVSKRQGFQSLSTLTRTRTARSRARTVRRR